MKHQIVPWKCLWTFNTTPTLIEWFSFWFRVSLLLVRLTKMCVIGANSRHFVNKLRHDIPSHSNISSLTWDSLWNVWRHQTAPTSIFSGLTEMVKSKSDWNFDLDNISPELQIVSTGCCWGISARFKKRKGSQRDLRAVDRRGKHTLRVSLLLIYVLTRKGEEIKGLERRRKDKRKEP